MTVLKASGLEAFLRRPDPETGVLLVYGEEPGAVREFAGRAVKHIAGSLDDPFSVVKLDDGDLGLDPARLIDEVQSLSMLGGQRAVWVMGAEQNFLKAVMPVLDGKAKGNFIVAEAGVLAKSSALRAALEKSPRAVIVPLYESEGGAISAAIEQGLARSGLKIEPEAKYRFMELIGSSRGLLQREVEKLELYAQGQASVTLADVEAVCGGGAGAETGDLVDAMFIGGVSDTDRLFHLLIQGGSDAGRLATAAHSHAMRLQDFRLAIERGGRADQVLRSARPPVFFKRQKLIQTQLNLWTVTALMQAASNLAGAVLQIRRNAAIGDSIANRSFLTIARNARALQVEGH